MRMLLVVVVVAITDVVIADIAVIPDTDTTVQRI